MSTADDGAASLADAVRRKIEDYRTTIQALQSFISVTNWDGEANQHRPDAHASFGRRMTRNSDEDGAAPNNVTPDAVVQRSLLLGYVVEAKKSLPANDDRPNVDRWRKIIDQLQKYDDELIGWWTQSEIIPTSNVVLLIHQTRLADFRAYLEELVRAGEVTFRHPISLVEFSRSYEVKEFIFLRKEWGQIEDRDVSRTLISGVSIPIEKLVSSYGEKKFYDTKPMVVEHTMIILWQDLFTAMRVGVDYSDQDKAWLLDVRVHELTLELQKLYGSHGHQDREVEYPKLDWVREALDTFVSIKLARRINDNGNYTILFKHIKSDLHEKFASHRKKSQKKPGVEQLSFNYK